MSTAAWTAFWKSVDIRTVRRNLDIKNYRLNSDFSALVKIGVNRAVAEDIYQRSGNFGDQLFFKKFSRYFRKDPDTIKSWSASNTITEAFQYLFGRINPKDLTATRAVLNELNIVFKLHRKGEGRQYAYAGVLNLANLFNPKKLVYYLNRNAGKDNAYKYYGTVKLGEEIIYCIQKKGLNGQDVYKFIQIEVQANKLIVGISMDSGREYSIVKRILEKWSNVFLDTIQSKTNLTRFENFLVSGESARFTLTGLSYFDDHFKITVGDNFNRNRNIAGLPAYKRKIQNSPRKEELISYIRIFDKTGKIGKPIIISFLTHRTAGILGAIKLNPNDRNLNGVRRNTLKKYFKSDFGISLNEFITYNDLDKEGIYKMFLENITQRADYFEIRSNVAMDIYQKLLADKLLAITETVEEQSRFCINRDCAAYYRVVWKNKFCSVCQHTLVDGKRFITQNVGELNMVNFIKSVYKDGDVTILSNKLIKRPLFIAKTELDGNIVEFIPINSDLRQYRMEILIFRYPNLMVVTTRDNVDELDRAGINAIRMYELAYRASLNDFTLISDAIANSGANSLHHLRRLFRISEKRILENQVYKDRNAISKNLGAELFEADCSVMLNYIFGSGIWLGAKFRGQSVPDGFTAFPLLNSQQGCFIWDAKFGEGKKLHMGGFEKNKTYIADARKNASIRANGGLKGFVFISNKDFPKEFPKKYGKLVKGIRVKIIFLSAGNLQKIAQHFKKHESLINTHEQAKSRFIDIMDQVFFKFVGRDKCIITKDEYLDPLLFQNNIELNRIKKQVQLKV